MPEPTGTEWIAAAVAGALVVLVGGLVVVTPGLRKGTRVASARIAGWLLACIAVALVLVSAVLVGAGIRASMVSDAELAAGEDLPSGPWVQHLFDRSLSTTEQVGVWGPVLLLPVAATFVVLALALVARERSTGLRVVAGGASASLMVVAGYVALGTTTSFTTDPGPLAGRSAAVIAGLTVAALVAVVVDALTGPPTT